MSDKDGNITDRGVSSAKHYSSGAGWKRGDLDFFTVPQRQYTSEEHDMWRALYRRQLDILPGRAI